MKGIIRALTPVISVFYMLIASSFTLASMPSAQTVDAVALESKVHDLSVDLRTLLLKYYHVQADENNIQIIGELMRKQQLTEVNQKAVLAMMPEQYSEEKQALATQWSAFKRYMDQNVSEIYEANYPELQVVVLMKETQSELLIILDKLQTKLARDYELSFSDSIQWNRQQKLLMLTVVERYLERSASSMGAPLTTDQLDITALCSQFARGIDHMLEKISDDAQQELLYNIQSKWVFIQNAATSRDSKLVPFLVMRYTDGILDRLTILEGKYS